jgi:ADP-heptose:LPS heptosyltransferase
LALISKGLKVAYLLTKTVSAIVLSYLKPSSNLKVTKLQDEKCKILLFGYMGLGDALMFQPSLRAILKAFPFAQIDIVVGTESQSRPMLQRLMQMEAREFHSIFEADFKSLSLSELRSLNRKIKRERYDIIICTYMSPTPYFTSAIMSAPLRVGHAFPWDKWYKPRPNRMFNISVRLRQDHEHETSRHSRLISKLIGEEVAYVTPNISLNDLEKKFADTFWLRNDLKDRIVIGTHFGASKAQNWKKWDDDRFAEVLRDLSAKYDPVFLHFGVASEKEQIEEASKFVKTSSINLAGQFSIFEVASLLSKCNAMLGNDSGLGHIAMAVGTSTLRVFGMSDYWGYRSLSDKHIDIFKGVECSPCLQLGYLKPYNVHNCGHKKCMKLISVAEVVSGFGELRSKS